MFHNEALQARAEAAVRGLTGCTGLAKLPPLRNNACTYLNSMFRRRERVIKHSKVQARSWRRYIETSF